MAQIDDYLRAHVAGALEPGEGIVGIGLLRRPKVTPLGTVAEYTANYLGVATDRRLIVFETQVSGGIMFGALATVTAQPIAQNPIEWRYDELAKVEIQGVNSAAGGWAVWLTPHPGLGPFAETRPHDVSTGVGRRYDIVLTVNGLDGQQAFNRQFPTWLEQGVARGAFPMTPARKAHVDAMRAARHARLAEEQAKNLAILQARDAKFRAAWAVVRPFAAPTAIALAGLGAIVVGLSYADEGQRLSTRATEEIAKNEPVVAMLEQDLATWVRSPSLLPPDDCPEKMWATGVGARRTCHNCWTSWPAGKPAPVGGRTFQRGAGTWACPSPEVYETDLKSAKAALASAEEEQPAALIELIAGGLGALVGLVVMAGAAVLGYRRRPRQAPTT